VTYVLVYGTRGGAMRIIAVLPKHLSLPTESPPPGAVSSPEHLFDDA